MNSNNTASTATDKAKVQADDMPQPHSLNTEEDPGMVIETEL